MRRGDLVTVTLPDDFRNPRPALIVQSDPFADHATVTVLPVTSAAVDAPVIRLPVDPTADNGISAASFVTVDKAMSVRTEMLGPTFGRLGTADVIRVDRALAVLLGIAA